MCVRGAERRESDIDVTDKQINVHNIVGVRMVFMVILIYYAVKLYAFTVNHLLLNPAGVKIAHQWLFTLVVSLTYSNVFCFTSDLFLINIM